MTKNTDRGEANETTAGPSARPKATRRTRTARPSAGDTFASHPEAATGMPHEESMVETRSESAMSRHAEPSEEDIRHRAYLRYLERGGGHGMDFEDWVQAEKELKTSSSKRST